MVAAGTDWVDGYWARKYGQVTQLGRILDPFVDKIIICGTFIFLASQSAAGLVPSRRQSVDGGRRRRARTAGHGAASFLEQQGSDFSAAYSGKIKFVLQCAVVALSLFLLSYKQTPPSDALCTTLDVVIWSMIVMTVYSGVAYIFAAVKLLRGRPAV